MNEFEVRTIGEVEARSPEDGKPARLVGYAAMFERESEDIGGFVEVIQPGAFKESISGDIRFLWNHDRGIILGRTPRTLKLQEDERGLAFDLELPDTTAGRDTLISVQRGDVSGMSFGFRVPKGGDSWTKRSDGMLLRRLKTVTLKEISSTPFPAYPDTSVAVRSLEEWKAVSWRPSVRQLRRRLDLIEGDLNNFEPRGD